MALFIITVVRSALIKGRISGGFKDTSSEDLILSAGPSLIEDTVAGNVLPPVGGRHGCPHGCIEAAYPDTAQHWLGSGSLPDGWSGAILTNAEAEDGLIPMGITSENVAAEFGILRKRKGKFAARSFRKAAAAQKAGIFEDEFIEKEAEPVVDADDGIRDAVTHASLTKPKPSFKKDGSTHAGNVLQMSDGAAAVGSARRSMAERLELPILGDGVPARITGVGPAYAIPKPKKKIDIPLGNMNVNGGAIATEHPLECTETRQISTGLSIATQRSESVSSGTGMVRVFVSKY
ncbi:acetyl-CoA acetyl transferase [Pisolithus albus]|nr:acetyl-CoA acetyl transferase [Pisolithus albus]